MRKILKLLLLLSCLAVAQAQELRLLSSDDNGLYWLSLSTGKSESLPKAKGGGSASLSPDGLRLLYSCRGEGDYATYLYDIAGQSSTRVVKDGLPLGWFPDGRFAVLENRKITVYDASRKRLSTSKTIPLNINRGSLSPDGKFVLFEDLDTRRDPETLIYTYNVASQALTKQIPGILASWHPKGTAFVATQESRLVSYEVATKTLKTVATTPPKTRISWALAPASYSQDGSQIVYVEKGEENHSRVVVVDPSGKMIKSFPLASDLRSLGWRNAP